MERPKQKTTEPERPVVIFPPNTSGPMTIANAMVFWVAWKMARYAGAEMWVRLDDRDRLRRPGEDKTDETLASVHSVASALGISVDRVYKFSDRILRYLEVHDAMLAEGVAIWERDGLTSVLAGTSYCRDAVLGYLREYNMVLMFEGRPFSSLTTAVDFHDFAVPYHVRGFELIKDYGAEQRVSQMLHVSKVLARKVITDYVTLPMLRLGGATIHTSAPTDNRMLFDDLAVGRSREELVALIESYVLRENRQTLGGPQDIAILKHVDVDATGKVVRRLPPERGMECCVGVYWDEGNRRT